jgi:hypothetical protein
LHALPSAGNSFTVPNNGSSAGKKDSPKYCWCLEMFLQKEKVEHVQIVVKYKKLGSSMSRKISHLGPK